MMQCGHPFNQHILDGHNFRIIERRIRHFIYLGTGNEF